MDAVQVRDQIIKIGGRQTHPETVSNGGKGRQTQLVSPMGYIRRYLKYVHFIPIASVGKRGAYSLVHGDLPRQHPFGTTLRFTGPVPADSRQ